MSSILESEVRDGAPDDRDSLTTIVDCDVHPLISDASKLRPYMSKRAQRRAFGVIGKPPALNARPVANRSNHPTTPLRLDALTPSGGPPGSDPQFAIDQWLDPYGISACLMIPVQAGLVCNWGDELAANELLSAMNDVFIEDWVRFDSRYRAILSVSPYNTEHGLKEIERLADVDGVAGVIIPFAGVDLGRSQYWPIYEMCADKGLPLVMHQTGAEGHVAQSCRIAGGLPTTWAERHTNLFQPGQSIVTSMVWSGVFERFPKLRMVVAEYGWSWLPSMFSRMDRAWDQGDRELAGLSKPPSQYVTENCLFSTQPFDEPDDPRELDALLSTFDAEHLLCFSSDYPHYDNDDPRLILNSRLPSRLRQKVAYQNALEAFGPRLGLDVPA